MLTSSECYAMRFCASLDALALLRYGLLSIYLSYFIVLAQGSCKVVSESYSHVLTFVGENMKNGTAIGTMLLELWGAIYDNPVWVGKVVLRTNLFLGAVDMGPPVFSALCLNPMNGMV